MQITPQPQTTQTCKVLADVREVSPRGQWQLLLWSQRDLRTRTYPDRPLSPTGKENSGLHVHEEASALSLCHLHWPSRSQWIKLIYQSHHTWKLSSFSPSLLIHWNGIDGTECLLRSPADGFFFVFGVQLLYNVVFYSAVQQSESAIHIRRSPLFWISFSFRSPESTE